VGAARGGKAQGKLEASSFLKSLMFFHAVLRIRLGHFGSSRCLCLLRRCKDESDACWRHQNSKSSKGIEGAVRGVVSEMVFCALGWGIKQGAAYKFPPH